MEIQPQWLYLLATGFALQLVAEPTIYQATGYSAADIAGVVEQFRRDISKGGVNNGILPSSQGSGWREIDWDVSTSQIDSFYTLPFGVSLGTAPNTTFRISTAPSSPSDPNQYFGDLNSTYRTSFQAFSSPSVMGAIGLANLVTMQFRVPSTDSLGLATVQGLGMVFSDIDLPNFTALTIQTAPFEQRTFYPPPSPGNGGLSFFGILMEPGSGILSAVVRLGNSALSPTTVDGLPFQFLPDRIVDLVVLDNIIFSEPRMIPEPSTLALVGSGLALIWLVSRLRSK